MDFSIAWNLFTALHCGEKEEILLTHATQPHDWRCGKLHSLHVHRPHFCRYFAASAKFGRAKRQTKPRFFD